MEFSFYRNIKGKLKKKGLSTSKKGGQADGSNQLVVLAKQLDDREKLDPDLRELTISSFKSNLASAQLGEFLMVARNLAKTQNKVVSDEEHKKLVVDVYREALLMCDRSFIRPIKLELGRFYESQRMFLEAAECYKQSMCISLCVRNLIQARKYQSALDELKNCPSHLMTASEYTSMFLLQLLLDDELDELKRCSLQHLSSISRTSTSRGVIPLDDHLFDLTGLLQSLLIVQNEDNQARTEEDMKAVRDGEIRHLIAKRLAAFLDQTQMELLNMINSEVKPLAGQETSGTPIETKKFQETLPEALADIQQVSE